MEFSESLKNAIKSKKLVLFVGSGLSVPHGLPNWNDLIAKFISHIERKYPSTNTQSKIVESMDPVKILDVLFDHKDDCFEVLRQLVDVDIKSEQLVTQKKLWKLSDKIVTTNYDKLLEKSNPNCEVVTYTDKLKLAKLNTSKQYLYKVHGSISEPKDCILFREQYEGLYNTDNAGKFEISKILSDNVFLFVGFSLSDPYFNVILKYLYSLYDGHLESHYVLSKYEGYYEDLGVSLIRIDNWSDIDVFLDDLIDFKSRIDFGFEEIKKDLSNKGVNYSDSDLSSRYNSFINEITSENVIDALSKANFNLAEDILNDQYQANLEKAAHNLYLIGKLNELRGNLPLAEEKYREALKMNPKNSKYNLQIGYIILHQRADLNEALSHFNKALNSSNIGDAEREKLMANCHGGIGAALIRQRKFDEALKHLNKGLEFDKIIHADNQVALASTYNNIATSYKGLFKYDEAFRYYSKALKELEKDPKRNYFEISMVETLYLSCYDEYLMFLAGDFDEIIDWMKP